jgi:AraC-like DNA-binding protein
MHAHEYINFWRDPRLDDLELLHATYITHSFAPHTHEGYVIGVIERGAEQFSYRGHHYVAPAGSIVFINPGEMHTGSATSEQGWTYRTLYPSIKLLQHAASELTGQARSMPFFAEPIVYDAEMSQELVNMHRVLGAQASALESDSRFLWTLSQLILRYADDHPRPRLFSGTHPGVQQARAYLDAYYAENISLAQLAAVAHLSPFHLLRAFREQVGIPPHAYHIQRRVEQAKGLLAAGWSCVDVALTVGFADQSHFSRNFKRITGVPPGRYSDIRR